MKSLPRETIVIDILKTTPVFNSLVPVPVPVAVPVPFPFSDTMFSTRPSKRPRLHS